MNNYVNYPSHTFHNGSCVICFSDGTYSWCFLTVSNKKYLSESHYLNNAIRVDIKTKDGKVYQLSPDQFREWAATGTLPDNEEVRRETPICPKCGRLLVLRTASKGPYAGKQFWGCSGYPKCTYSQNL